MASLKFPDTGTRLALLPTGAPAGGRQVVLYADAAGSTLAEIYADSGGVRGALIANSTITTDSHGQLPDFWGPNDRTDRLYARVNGGPVVIVDADYDARIDALDGLALNVKNYGAVGNGSTDDTTAVTAAVAAALAGGRTLYFPKGTYKVAASTLTLSATCRLVGENSLNTTISSTTAGSKTGIGLKVTGNDVEVADLTISGFYSAIESNSTYTKIYDNKLTGNAVGIDFATNSYIIAVRRNQIVFNDLGIVCRAAAQPYELNITDNIIDNNNGVGLALGSSSGGFVIEHNTIEGNRSFTSTVGCGILLRGANVSRLQINGNWFESNGLGTTDSADILMLSSGVDSTTAAVLRASIVPLLPTDVQALFATSGVGAGTVAICENSFQSTKYGCVLSGDKIVIDVARNSFKGIKDRFNKHIFISVPTGTYGLGGSRFNIHDNGYANTDDPTIDPQVTTGIDSTIVYTDQAFNTASADVCVYNGQYLDHSKFPTAIGAATTTDIVTTKVAGDSVNRHVINADGTHEWGSGAATTDVTLYRSGANTLATDDTFTAALGIQVTRTSALSTFQTFVTGDTVNRLRVDAAGKHEWGAGAGSAVDTNLYRSAADVLASDDDISLKTAGKGFQVKEGTNAKMGTAVLVGGTATVSTTAVTANARVFLTSQVDGGTPGFLRVSTRTAATSFVITSSSGSDTSTVAWLIFEPSA